MFDRAALTLRAAIVGGAWLTTFFVCAPAMAQQPLGNGGFESGDIAGWTPGGPAGSSVTVVASFVHEREHRPQEGGYLALLATPAYRAPVTLSQTFHAQAGAVISGWAIFRSGTAAMSQNQYNAAYTIAIRSGNGERIVLSNDNGESTGWMAWNYVVPGDGEYTIVATALNGYFGASLNNINNSYRSYLGLDGIMVTAPRDSTAPAVSPPGDVRVEIRARETSAPVSHPNIAAFLAGATASDNRDGTIAARALNPPASFPVGDTAVTFEAVDAAGNRGTASARVTVVKAPNGVPVAVDDTTGIQAGTTAQVSVTANDSDPDGDPLTAALVKPPTRGRAELGADGTLRYTPEAGFAGDDALTYAIEDGLGGRAEAVVRIAVAAPPPPPQPLPPPVTPPPPPAPSPAPVTPLPAPATHPEDVEGSADHPLVARFEGSRIIDYVWSEFDEYPAALGGALRLADPPVFAKAERLEGKVTRILYAVPEGRSSLEVFRSYTAALAEQKFTTLFECSGGSCGQWFYLRSSGVFGAGRSYSVRDLFITTPKVQRYVAARLGDSNVYAFAYVAETDTSMKGTFVHLDVVEVRPMEIGMMPAGAAAPRPGDVEGSADHPLVTRFRGSRIIDYVRRALDEYQAALGGAPRLADPPVFAKAEKIEGAVTRILYAVPKGRSSLEVFRNYTAALAEQGFTTLFECRGNFCGQWFYKRSSGVFGAGRSYSVRDLFITTPKVQRYVAARRGDSNVYAFVYVAEMNTSMIGTFVHLDVVEGGSIAAR
ncbi:MAG: DUF4892 domain-containing protein [Acidobacteria bacterium]|nr:DUF4892 domain-containing protein [Acidobacteriota bacterium]